MTDIEIETTLVLIELSAVTVRFAASSARNAVRETRQQCADSQRFARAVCALEAERDYLGARSRTPEAVLQRPDAAANEQLDRFMVYVDDLIAAKPEASR